MVLDEGFEFLMLCWLPIKMRRFGKGNGRIEVDLCQASSFWGQMTSFSMFCITENQTREPLGFYLNFSIFKYFVKHLFLKDGIIEVKQLVST